MSLIFAKCIWIDENRKITKKDLINERFECDIFINEKKLTGNNKCKKKNRITYLFKKNYSAIHFKIFGSGGLLQN